MKLIAHRGLTHGPNKDLENSESSVKLCLKAGFDVEVDLWFVENKWFLGHDLPQHKTTVDFVFQSGLWIHAKNFEAAEQLARMHKSANISLNYFWHDNDDRTLTSFGYWWTYPNKPLSQHSVAVMPEWHLPVSDIKQCLRWKCHAVCSDYVGLMI